MPRERETVDELEDVTGSAGWMYTDLFVGLMVIFLATISFIPAGRTIVDKNAVQTYTNVFKTPLAIRYSSFDINQIDADLKKFETAQGILGTSQIAHLQIIGSYNPATESAEKAQQRAIAIDNAISAAMPNLMQHGTTSYGSFADKNTSNFVLQFTFQVEVQVLKNTGN